MLNNLQWSKTSYHAPTSHKINEHPEYKAPDRFDSEHALLRGELVASSGIKTLAQLFALEHRHIMQDSE